MKQFPAKIDGVLAHEVIAPWRQAEAYPTVVLLHGRGATAGDLLPLAPELGRDDLLAIAPQAPYELRGPFGLGFAWYEMPQFEGSERTGIALSLQRLDEFLDAALAAYPIDRDRLVLLGFSQGAVMALAAGLHKPRRTAGVVALSGYLDDSTARADADQLAGLPVFMAHGNRDLVIPLAASYQSREDLITCGADVSYHEYPAGHEITPEELADIRRWLEPRLA